MRCYASADTPYGEILLAGDARGRLTGVYWPEHSRTPRPGPGWRRDDGAFADAVAQLGEYFAGQRRGFTLDLAPQGTPFQHRVWSVLGEIPYGETITYAQLAGAIGRPGAARAVGLANGRNPLSIVVPCHRVVGTDGGLTGYAGGLGVKAELLEFERACSRYSDGTMPWRRRNALANCAGSL